MTHLFKINLPDCDLFISAIDEVNTTITYKVYTKDGGVINEARTAPYATNSESATFDGAVMPLQTFLQIVETLEPEIVKVIQEG